MLIMAKNSISTKTPLKEKVVQIYEMLLKGEDPSVGNPNFWDEFFLLRANVTFLENEFERMTSTEVTGLKDVINLLFYRCVFALKDDNLIRVVNSLQTMCALVRGIYRKSNCNYGFDTINLLIGFNSAESQMQILIEQLSHYLSLDYPRSIKTLILKFFLILVTAAENVSQNTLLEYLMMNSVFEAIIQILQNPKSRQHHGYDAVLLLSILVNYRKYDAANPYIMKLSIVDDEMALNGFGQVIALALLDFNRKFCERQTEPQSGFLWSFTSLVGSMFVADDIESGKEMTCASNAVLLALYEIVHLNRNFLITLTHCQTDAPLTPLCEGYQDSKDPDSATLTSTNSDHILPTNLLVTFLEFSSIIMQNTKEEENINICKLCFIVLTCIAEDQYANSIMHDINLVFKVHLHRMPMRHRKLPTDRNMPSRPLAFSLLDLMVEFVQSHMTKALPFELYYLCLGVIQRILCYQKRGRIRLQYNWKELWTALICLLKFLMTHEAFITKNPFPLANQVVNILNLFITFGDTFLPSPSFYDDLYYEIVRMNTVFENMYSIALRYTTSDAEWKDFASKLTNSLVNIRAIINHFSPKIEAWSIEHCISSLTEAQVLEVVRTNYDTLTLKLYDNLDQYEKYSEKPQEVQFFTLLVRSVVSEYRQSLSFKSLEMQNILKEFTIIT